MLPAPVPAPSPVPPIVNTGPLETGTVGEPITPPTAFETLTLPLEVLITTGRTTEPALKKLIIPEALPEPSPVPPIVKIGAPLVQGASVQAKVLSQGRHEKVKIFKMRRRKHYQKHQGHRQNFTEIQISGISA